LLASACKAIKAAIIAAFIISGVRLNCKAILAILQQTAEFSCKSPAPTELPIPESTHGHLCVKGKG
jgi:hypothetical protein